MRRRKAFCCIALAIALQSAGNAWARLGETPEQCAERYGPVIEKSKGEGSVGETIHVYQPGPFRIVIGFLEGRAGYLMILKQDRSDLSADGLNLFLSANAGNATWQASRDEGQRPGLLQKFDRSDGRAHAVIAEGDQMMIESVAYKAARLGMSKF